MGLTVGGGDSGTGGSIALTAGATSADNQTGDNIKFDGNNVFGLIVIK